MDFDAPARMPFPPSVYGAGRYGNAYAAHNAPLGAALEKLVTSLYAGDPEGKQQERASLVADRQAQAHLRQAQIDKLTREGSEATAADVARKNAPDAIAAGMFGGAPQGAAVMGYRNAGGVVQPQAETSDVPGIVGGYAMDRPAGYTSDKEDELNSILKFIGASQAIPGKSTVDQLAQAVGHSQDQAIKAKILGGDYAPDQASQGMALLKASPVYHEGPSGGTTNAYTGAVNQATPVAIARAAELTGQAVNQRAQAGTQGARTAQIRSETLPQVQVPAPAGVGAPGSTVPALGKDVSKEITKPAQASSAGDQTYQDPATSKTYVVNRNGSAKMMTDDGTWQSVNPNELPRNLQKVGNIGAAGSRENIMLGRVGLAAGQATNDLANIARMPLTASTGVFGGAHQGPSLLNATSADLANTVTGQEAQSYRVKATGFQRNLAAIEAAGLMPNGTLTGQMDSVLWREGDTQLTKLQKLAQTRQIVETGISHVLENPRLSDSEKAKLRTYATQMEKSVPFTHLDLDNWVADQQDDPPLTLGDFLASRPKQVAPTAPVAAPSPTPAPSAGRIIHYDAAGKRVQ